MSQSAVEFVNVSKSFGANAAVSDLNLTISSGKIVTIIGPSGCGKTTTLKMINRLVDPSSGTVLVEGNDISQINPVELRRTIGYVIQQIGLFPHMTIEDNISIVPRLKGAKKKDTARRTEELLDLIGLDPSVYRHRFPRELSGGQQQRIGVARALAADPSIILMDEPFSALDPITREQLQEELLKLQEAVNKTIIFVTHDMDEAFKIADQIILLKDGQLVQSASPDQFLRQPKDDYVKEFIGENRFKESVPMITAREAMIHGISVHPSMLLAEAVRHMNINHSDTAIVSTQESEYLGVITMKEVYEHYGNENIQVADAMEMNLTTVREHTPIAKVLELLNENRQWLLPVIDSNDLLLGVVTRTSVINSMAALYHRQEVMI